MNLSGPRYWLVVARIYWHIDVLGHTITGQPPDPWNVLRCSCGTRIVVRWKDKP